MMRLPPIPAATHPPAAADLHGRFAVIAKASELQGSEKWLAAALKLAALSHEMSAAEIIDWVTTHIPIGIEKNKLQ